VADSLALSADRRSELLAMFDSIERVQAGNAAEPADGASAASNSGAAAASAGGSSPAAAVLAVPAASATTTPRLTLPYTVRTEEASSRPSVKYNSYAHAFAGMGVQFILFAGIDLGIGLLAMRRLGLWKRLRASPISKALLLGSRIASTAITALVLLVIIFAAAIAFFDVRVEGSWVGMAGVALAFALMTAGFGLLIAALGRTPEATRGLAIFATLVLVMLGGAWVPAFVFPQWLQTVSLFVPTRWAVDGLDAMTWRGLGLQAALAPIGVMLLFALVFALIALMKFDWEE
jgi:ABC-2 type transport system permease protein